MADNNKYDIQPKYCYNFYFCGGPFLWRPLGTCPVCPVLNPALHKTTRKSRRLCVPGNIGTGEHSADPFRIAHKFGSAEVVRLTHEHGLSASYDEVLRFRKSAAKYIWLITRMTSFNRLSV